jgi:pyruvate/2-oxoglutarate dehydrogenase complex dihydrolipoamide dehydrogenase (E3) component
MSQKFDIIVIGGGPAGVTAALQARELGASVALVERGRMGEPVPMMGAHLPACWQRRPG